MDALNSVLIIFLIGAFSVFINSYLKEKGKFHAMFENQKQVLDNQLELLRESEKIKAEFDTLKFSLQHQSWIDEQRWQFRKDLFLEVIDILLEAREFAILIEEQIAASQKTAKGLTSGDEDSGESEILAEKIVQDAYDEAEAIISEKLSPLDSKLKALLNRKGILFLSTEAINSMSLFINSSSVWDKEEKQKFADSFKRGEVSFEDRPDISYEGYLLHFVVATNRAYREIIRIAKSDLKISQ